MIRVYVPGALTEVIAWFDAGGVPAGTGVHCVSEQLRAANPDADDEELEYLATQAAHAAVAAGRPVVLAVDVTELAEGVLIEDAEVADWAALFVDDLQWFAVDEIDLLR